MDGDNIRIVDRTDANLGGTYADPAAMRGRAPDGHRRWSLTEVEREVRYAWNRQSGGDRLARPPGCWEVEDEEPFPSFARLRITTPESACNLPVPLGGRPGTRFVRVRSAETFGEENEAVFALDPGGDLADWRHLGLVNHRGRSARVSTDPTQYDAQQLDTLDARAVEWSNPPRSIPIDELQVERFQYVGRVGGIIDADIEGLDDLASRRLIYDDNLPCHRCCQAANCNETVLRASARYCSRRCRDREAKRRSRRTSRPLNRRSL